MKTIGLIIIALLSLGGFYLYTQSNHTEDMHDHSGHQEESHEGHGHDSHEKEDSHDDHSGHDHHDHSKDHEENSVSHDEHDHDNHGHKDEHGHDEHEEGKTEIEPEHAKQAGVVLSKAQGGTISQNISLTGQIILNSNRSADVKARFTGAVKSVKVKLGQKVTKGQVLARVESNESLQVFNVKAPISGTILKRNTNIGNLTSDEPMFKIVDLSKVWAKFHIFPKDTNQIKEGQSVIVHTLGNDEKEAASTIKMLLPTSDALSQTYVAIVELDNENGDWRPGMTVEGDVSISQENASIIVPTSAIQTMEDQKVVFIESNNSYEARPVKTGKIDNETIEIVSGLDEGESYVSQGSFIIKADILKAGAAHEH